MIVSTEGVREECLLLTTRAELATAIFEYIEAFYNPVRRHSALDYRNPIDYERHHTTTNTAA